MRGYFTNLFLLIIIIGPFFASNTLISDFSDELSSKPVPRLKSQSEGNRSKSMNNNSSNLVPLGTKQNFKVSDIISQIGFITVHGTLGMNDILTYYGSIGVSVETISSNISEVSLNQFPLVFCGEGDSWSSDEITSLEAYISRGGIFVSIGDPNSGSGAIEVANQYGISLLGWAEGSYGTTTAIDSYHPLMENITSLYLPSSSSSLVVNEPATPIVWDNTGTGIYGASVDIGAGKLLILATEIYYSIYNADNAQFFTNILSWDERSPKVKITSSKYSNSDYNFTWDYNFDENETSVLSQIFMDGSIQGSTSVPFFLISAPLEGIYNISIIVESNASNFYQNWKMVTFDYTLPTLGNISLANNSYQRYAYLDFNWTVNDNLSGINSQKAYLSLHNSSILQDITFWAHNLYGGGAETTFNKSGEYILEIHVYDNAGNSNITKLIINVEVYVIGVPIHHGQDYLPNIINFYYSQGCYIDFFNETGELTSEWLENKDLVLISGSGYESYSREELLLLEEWFTNGGWILQVGGTNNSYSYSKWLARLGLSFGNTLVSSYSSNFNTSYPLFTDINSLYFANARDWEPSNSFNPVVWDQGGSRVLVGAISRLGTFLAIGGAFDNGIWTADNQKFLLNILDAAVNATTEGIFFNPTSLLSNSSQKQISWNWSIQGAEIDHLDLWLDESYIGTVINNSVKLKGLSEGNHNLTIVLYDNQSRSFRNSQILLVDLISPNISSFTPLNGSKITVVFGNSTWTSSDNHSGVIFSRIMMKSPSANLTLLPLDIYGGGAPLYFSEEGSHVLYLEVSDWAGNVATYSVVIEVNYFSIGFIQSHNEGALNNIKNYCYSLNGRIETLYQGESVTIDRLKQFDLIWIGYGGNAWENSEIQVLTQYYETGGWIFYLGRQGYSVPLNQWFLSFGLEVKDSGPGSAYSSTFLHNHPIFTNVNQLYLSSSSSWDPMVGDFLPIAWSQDGFYQTICALEYRGAIFASAGDLDSSLYTADNVILLENILNESNQDLDEGVYFDESDLLINSSEYNVSWHYSLTNASLDYVEIYYDEILQGSTSNSYWSFSGLSEGLHTLTAILYDTQFQNYTTSRNIIVDLSTPIINLVTPLNGSIATKNILDIHWSSTDTITETIQTKLFMKGPNNSSWSELWLMNETFAQVNFIESGEFSFKISVWDRVGNREDEYFYITVDIYTIGFIQNHDEDDLWGIRSYYSNQGYLYESIYYGDPVTLSWLFRFDVVFIGYSGSGIWTGSEIMALENYLASGGWIVYVGRDTFTTPLESWLGTKGITFNLNGPGSIYTTNFPSSHPLFQNVSQLYFQYTSRTWSLSGNAQPIIWSEDGFYTVGAFVEGIGGLIALSGDIDDRTYYADNERFLNNIINEAGIDKEGISLTYSSLLSNSTTLTVEWNWFLENSSLDYFEVYLDSILQGNTTNDYWSLNGLIEGVYNITIIMYDNTSGSCVCSGNLMIDLTNPIITVIYPISDVINQASSHLQWNASDTLTGISDEKVFEITPTNSSWNELYIDPWNPSYIYLSFYESGEYRYKISAWDHAGNRHDEVLTILVDIPMIGFIQNHYENELWNIRSFYSNEGYLYESIQYGSSITLSWLSRFDVVFIGYGGSGIWTGPEIAALEEYLNSGGWIVYVGRDTYATPLESWLGTKGITFNQNGPGSLYTINFDSSHLLFQNVSQLYFRYTYRTWSLSGNAQPIIWSEDGLYTIGAFVESLGGLVALSGDINYRTYYADNERFLNNIINEAGIDREGISLTYSSLLSNSTTHSVEWNWYLENSSLDYFEVYLDSILQGNTTEDYWSLSGLTEGVYNITLIMYDNYSSSFVNSRDLTVDLTSPVITVIYPISNVINQTSSYLLWNASDTLTGISNEKVFEITPINTSWDELYIDPWNPSYVYLSFYESGEYKYKISVWDYAGNRQDEVLTVLVDIPTIAFIQNHYENDLWNIRSYYENQDYFCESIYYGSFVTFSWLSRFDVVFIGYGGSGIWTGSEITALDDYLNSGGWIVYVSSDTYTTPLENWLNTKGIAFNSNNPGGSIYTSNFNADIPLFSGINELYLRYTFRSWSLSGNAQPIIWSNDGVYTVGAFLEGLGGLIALSGDINYRTYYSDNEAFLTNILEESYRHQDALALHYSNIWVNNTNPLIEWSWYLENSSLEKFEVYLDSVLQGNTTDAYWQLDGLTETSYEFTVRMYDNNSHIFNSSQRIHVDLIAPDIYIISPESTDIMTLYQIVVWNVSDDFSGIRGVKAYLQTLGSSEWSELPLYYYDLIYMEIYFPIEGEYRLRFNVWDNAGNLRILILELVVDLVNPGFIENHYENRLTDLYDFFYSRNIDFNRLSDPQLVTYEWLIQHDIVFIGSGGQHTWTSQEFDALDAYLDAEGWIIYINRETYTSNLFEWFETKGISSSTQGPGDTIFTSDFNKQDSLFTGVESLYFSGADGSLQSTLPAESIISYSGYSIAASFESIGRLLVFSGDPTYYLYENSTRQFFENIIREAYGEIEGIRIKGGTMTAINTTDYNIIWTANPPNAATVLEYIVEVDGISIISTVNTQYLLSNLDEGTHIIKIKAILNNSDEISDEQTVIVDISNPTISVQSPVNNSNIYKIRFDIIWISSDLGSGISTHRIEIWDVATQGWIHKSNTPGNSYAFVNENSGNLKIRITVFDKAGNSIEAIITINVVIPEILYIHTNYDHFPSDLFYFYLNKSIQKELSSELLNESHLTSTDIVVICGGRDPWEASEISALTNYLNRGGKLLVFASTRTSTVLSNFLAIYGLSLISERISGGITTYHSHRYPLFDNVTEFSVPTVSLYIEVNRPSTSIVYDPSGEYSIIARYEGLGGILLFSCDPNELLHHSDNDIFFDNILEWVKPQNETEQPQNNNMIIAWVMLLVSIVGLTSFLILIQKFLPLLRRSL